MEQTVISNKVGMFGDQGLVNTETSIEETTTFSSRFRRDVGLGVDCRCIDSVIKSHAVNQIGESDISGKQWRGGCRKENGKRGRRR
jgi:hypothetical protein